jgi:hypothetical protein
MNEVQVITTLVLAGKVERLHRSAHTEAIHFSFASAFPEGIFFKRLF